MDPLNPSSAPPPSAARRSAGRPRKSDAPRVNYVELDELLVFGEPCATAPGGVCYPSYRELAARYGVANSVIADFARQNRCRKRRKYVAAKIRARADEKQIELRATALASGHPELTPATGDVLQEARREVLHESRAT